MSSSAPKTLYLTTLCCGACEESTTIAHEGEAVALDAEPEWPDVDVCPKCGAGYPDDLGIAVEEVQEAEPRPPRDPTEVEHGD